MHSDLIVREGEVVDGTGAEPGVGSIGILGDRLEAVGDLADATADRAIPCSGCVIASGPRFIAKE